MARGYWEIMLITCVSGGGDKDANAYSRVDSRVDGDVLRSRIWSSLEMWCYGDEEDAAFFS